MTDKQTPFVSVIIPVLNDPVRLAICLKALEQQTYPEGRFEIIVVDNGSQQPIEPIVARFPHAWLAFETQPSSYAARNTGIALAQGTIFAFTDADCIPACDWIEHGVRALQSDPQLGIVGGRVRIFPKDEAHLTMVELYEMVMAFPQGKYIQEYKFSTTANLFTHKTVFDAVGLFNAEKLKSGGDMEWGRRVAAAGYGLLYVPNVCTQHPARHSFAQLYKKMARVAGGLYDGRPPGQRSFLGFDSYLLKGLLPPIRSAIHAFKDERITDLAQKIQIVCMVFFVKYVQAFERFRLNLGGQSRRE